MTFTLTKPPTQEERSIIISGVTWEQMESLEAIFDQVGGGVRFFYLDGSLEIMTLGTEHGFVKSTIRLLLEAYLREKNIRFYARGGPTFGSKEDNARKEPDQSYNLATKKSTPDLVIEVVFTSGGLDKLEFYRRFGVTEVWFWEDGVLSIYYLENEQYQKVTTSQLLPELDLTLFCRYITYFDQYDAVTEFVQALRMGSGL